MENKENLQTKMPVTWCPGCTNIAVLTALKKAIAKLIGEGARQEDFAMVTGIGCHGKIFDYMNISGIYGLHGRVIPTAFGVKLGNPKLNVLGFSGDGDAYAEGMEHFIHAFRYNADMTYIVHDNQTFSLTTGQATPTSNQGFKSKAEPLGNFSKAINPLALALASGGTFIARCNSLDVNTTAEIFEKAIKHKGFAYIELMQNCIIFNNELPKLSKLMYNIEPNTDKLKAEELVKEWDYNSKQGKIPIGIIYQTREPTLEEKWPQFKTNFPASC